jgi:hypothetical protein
MNCIDWVTKRNHSMSNQSKSCTISQNKSIIKRETISTKLWSMNGFLRAIRTLIKLWKDLLIQQMLISDPFISMR